MERERSRFLLAEVKSHFLEGLFLLVTNFL